MTEFQINMKGSPPKEDVKNTPLEEYEIAFRVYKQHKKKAEKENDPIARWKALSAIRRCVETLPPDVDPMIEATRKCMYAHAHWDIGIKAKKDDVRQEHIWAANDIYSEYVDQDDNLILKSMATANFGRFHVDRGNLAKAKDLFIQSIDVGKTVGFEDSKVYTGLTNICISLGEEDDAEPYLKERIGINGSAANNLIRLCMRQERYSKAKDIVAQEVIRLERVQKLNEPEDADGNNYIYYLASAVAITCEDWQDVEVYTLKMSQHNLKKDRNKIGLLLDVAGTYISQDINQRFCDKILDKNRLPIQRIVSKTKQELVKKYTSNGHDYFTPDIISDDPAPIVTRPETPVIKIYKG